MKVLALTNLYPPDVMGGYEVGTAQVVDGLRRLGHDVMVLTATPRRPVEDGPGVSRRLRLADEWDPNAMGSFPVRHLVTHARSRFVSAHNVHQLIQAVRSFRPDVAYLGNLIGVGGLGLIEALRVLGVRWAWNLGDCVPAQLCSSRLGVVPALAEEFSRRVAGTYIVVSEGVRRETEALGTRLNGRVERLPNWVAGERPPDRDLRRAAGPLRVMSAGSVNRDKGIDILIEAAGRLVDSGFDDFVVDVYGRVGDGSLVGMIADAGLGRHVRLMGPRPHPEILRLYGDYDVFAFPTQEREPFGMVALEAASRGCVPVLTRRCGVAEWLVHGVHCLKVERSAESLAEALLKVGRGEISLVPIAAKAREAAWRDFHLDRILPTIERLLADEARGTLIDDSQAEGLYRQARMAEQLVDGLIEESTRGDVTGVAVPSGLRKARGGAA